MATISFVYYVLITEDFWTMRYNVIAPSTSPQEENERLNDLKTVSIHLTYQLFKMIFILIVTFFIFIKTNLILKSLS